VTLLEAEMLDILADVECALVMTRNHTPEITVGSFVDSSTQFKRLADFLRTRSTQEGDHTP
jgi:hypothetical protein